MLVSVDCVCSIVADSDTASCMHVEVRNCRTPIWEESSFLSAPEDEISDLPDALGT